MTLSEVKIGGPARDAIVDVQYDAMSDRYAVPAAQTGPLAQLAEGFKSKPVAFTLMTIAAVGLGIVLYDEWKLAQPESKGARRSSKFNYANVKGLGCASCGPRRRRRSRA